MLPSHWFSQSLHRDLQPFGCYTIRRLPREHPEVQDTTHSDCGLEGAFLGWDLYTPTVWLWSFKKRKPVRMHDPVFFKSKFPFSDPTVLLNKDFTKQEVQQMHSAVSAGVMEMDRFTDHVRRSATDVVTISRQMEEIIERVNGNTARFERVHESMQSQSQGAQQISDAMVSLTENATQTAEAVVEAGAPCVVLASRSGKVKYSDQGLDERLEALRACGAKVVLERCDTSIEADVEATLKRVRKHGPLRVVVHAAGTLSDGLLPAQDSTSVQKVWGPKADGAWFLHKHTANNDQCLGAFIVYSSVSSLFGGVGQANYSAANAYLDELVRWRVDRGLTGMSAQWPSVLGVGMAAAMDDRFKEDVKLSISVHTVKQVVTQMLDMAPTITASAVQAVVPRGLLEKGVLPDAVALLLESVQVCLVTRCCLTWRVPLYLLTSPHVIS